MASQYDFKYLTHFVDQPQATLLENFFRDVSLKVSLELRYAQSAVNLFRAEYQKQLGELESKFNSAITDAQTKYKRIMAESEDEEKDHFYAAHESGIDEIASVYEDNKESIQRWSIETRDRFYNATLCSVYAFAEHELRTLCNLLQKEMDHRLTLDKWHARSYLKEMEDYLNYIIGLPTATLEPFLSELKNLQFLRNRFMHNGGEFTNNSSEATTIRNIVDASSGGLTIYEHEEANPTLAVTRLSFIEKYYCCCQDFFYELLLLVDAKLNTKMLAARFQSLFSFFSNDALVSIQSFNRTSSSAAAELTITGNYRGESYSYKCRCRWKKASKAEFKFTQQVEGQELVDRLYDQLDYGDMVEKVLRQFCVIDQIYTIDMILWEEKRFFF